MANVRLKNIQFPGLDNTYTIPDEAPAYSTSGTYAVGDMVIYDGKLYKCTTAITTAEAWTAAHWSETKMGNEVSELKTALFNITGVSEIKFINGSYIKTNGGVGTIVNPTPISGSSTNNYAIVDCVPNDKFTINATGGNAGRLWCFCDSNYTILAASGQNITGENLILTAPENAAKLILNPVTGYGYCCKGVPTDISIAELSESVDNEDNINILRSKLTLNGETTATENILTHGDLGASNGLPYSPVMLYRAYTKPILVFPYDVDISCPSGYYLRIFYYTNKIFDHLVAWTNKHTVPANSEIRVVIRKYPEDTSATVALSEFANNINFKYNNFLDGVGSNVYSGEKVVLKPDFVQQNRCDIQLWKDFTNTDDSWKLYDAQGMEIYNGNMFIFTSDGIVDVVDMETKNVISTFLIDSTKHYNAVQFSNIFYSANDTYPLLFVTDSPNYLVYRIEQSGTTFTASLINTINFSFLEYSGAFTIDNKSKTIHVATYTNGGYDVYANNPITVRSFEMPTETSIKSGTQITITADSALSVTQITHATMQDAKALSGMVYYGITNESETSPKQFVWVYDTQRNEIVSIIRMSVNLEFEGLAISDGTMFVSQRRGATSGNDNPLNIYSINF